MTRFRISLSICVAALGLLLVAAPAEAINNVVSYVSVFTGSNANSCDSPSEACQSIGGALVKPSKEARSSASTTTGGASGLPLTSRSPSTAERPRLDRGHKWKRRDHGQPQ